MKDGFSVSHLILAELIRGFSYVAAGVSHTASYTAVLLIDICTHASS